MTFVAMDVTALGPADEQPPGSGLAQFGLSSRADNRLAQWLIAQCPDERKKVEMLDPKPYVTKERRRPAIKGRCPSCGKTLFRFSDPSLIDEA